MVPELWSVLFSGHQENISGLVFFFLHLES